MMRTDDLVAAIVADNASVKPSITTAMLSSFAVATVACALIFMAVLGVRGDFSQSIVTSAPFQIKFVLTLAAAIAALAITLRLSRPENEFRQSAKFLALPVGLLMAAVVAEMAVTPQGDWVEKVFGGNYVGCLLFVPLLSVAPLALILLGLRNGAPASPATAGAFAGLLAAGIAATFYASFCPADSPLFVGIWYPISTAVVVAIGSVIGSRLLRW